MTSREMRLFVDRFDLAALDLETDGSIAFSSSDMEGERRALVMMGHHANALVALFEECVGGIEDLPPGVVAAVARVLAIPWFHAAGNHLGTAPPASTPEQG